MRYQLSGSIAGWGLALGVLLVCASLLQHTDALLLATTTDTTFTNESTGETTPAMPDNFDGAYYDGVVELVWRDRADNETHFRVLRFDMADETKQVWEAPADGEGFIDKAPPVGDNLYLVEACNDVGCSKSPDKLAITVPDESTSSTGSTDATSGASDSTTSNDYPPAAPDAFDGVYKSGRIELFWQDRADTEAFYRVIRRDLTDDVSDYDRLSADVERFYDEAIFNGHSYRYAVEACNDAGCAAASNVVTIDVSHEEETTTQPDSNVAATTTHTWQFSDGQVTSVVLDLADEHYRQYLNDVNAYCLKVSKDSFTWMDDVDDPSKPESFGIPNCHLAYEALRDEHAKQDAQATTSTVDSISREPAGTLTLIHNGAVLADGEAVRGEVLLRVASTPAKDIEVAVIADGVRRERIALEPTTGHADAWLGTWRAQDSPAGYYELVALYTSEEHQRLPIARRGLVVAPAQTLDQAIAPDELPEAQEPPDDAVSASEPEADDADTQASTAAQDQHESQEEAGSQTSQSAKLSPPPLLAAERRAELEETFGEAAECRSRQACTRVCQSQQTARTCEAFVTEEVVREHVRHVFDGVDAQRLREVISSDAFAFADTVEEAVRYCSDPAHEIECQTALVQSRVMSSDEANSFTRRVAASRAGRKKAFTERVGARAVLDRDADGVTDFDEINVYKTDPTEPDSDGDGIADGEELLRHTSPLRATVVLATSSVPTEVRTTSTPAADADDALTFEDPRIIGEEHPELLAVDDVALQSSRAATRTAERLALAGRAMPNSFVTIYVFSVPLVVTVRTGPDGVWEFAFDEELPDGSHRAYAAITDSAGRVLAKSRPLPFVKEAQAVTVGAVAAEPLAAPDETPTERFLSSSLLLLVVSALAFLGLFVAVLGYLRRGRKASEPVVDSRES